MKIDFFLNEILEDENVRELVRNGPLDEARKIASSIMRGERVATPEAGVMQLCVVACLADFALQKNHERRIPREITVATLKDVNVWIENYTAQHGAVGLGEFCWLKLHYCGKLFRLGRLQFCIERSIDGVPSGEYAIGTHIPQGEPLVLEDCLASFDMARGFFKDKFPEYKPDYFICDSWLLNPNLRFVAGAESNIVKFMSLWTKIPFEDDGSAQAIQRVFGFDESRETLATAPEDTGLQRRMKAYLLSGGEMKITAGYIKI